MLIATAVRRHADLAPGLAVLWMATLAGSIALPLASTALLGAVVGAVGDGPSAIAGPLAALAAVEVAHAPCAVYGWVLCWAMGRRYRLVHRERIMRVLLEPPGVAHIHAPTLDAAHASDNVWVVNMLEGVNNLLVSRVTGFGAIVIIGRYQPLAAVILAVSWIVMGSWRWRRMRVTWTVQTGQAEALRRSMAMSDLSLAPTAAKEVRLFGLGTWLTARFAREWFGAMEHVWSERKAAARGAAGIAALLLGGHVAALALIARDAANGEIGLGALAAVLQAVLLARELGEGVMGQWEVDYGLPLVAMVDRLEQVVEANAELLTGRVRAFTPQRVIAFEDVWFRYPGGHCDVLAGFSLEIPAGTSLAIVGENGAGKTTTVQLLARLRDPTAGRITVDGSDLRDIEPISWHRRVAAVSQQALRLPLDVVDNIGAGRDAERHILEQAARDAGILDVIEDLPLGWHTPLAKGFAGGADLSGGQWQRIALARGLVALATDADLLVLDEPTAHLDVRAEAEVYQRFLGLTKGRTTLLISHRFSTVRRADRIAVLEGGGIVEIGTHDELIGAGGRYATMYALQAARFVDADPSS